MPLSEKALELARNWQKKEYSDVRGRIEVSFSNKQDAVAFIDTLPEEYQTYELWETRSELISSSGENNG